MDGRINRYGNSAGDIEKRRIVTIRLINGIYERMGKKKQFAKGKIFNSTIKNFGIGAIVYQESQFFIITDQ
jgi:hypothetical protein